jgi:hypothetical protein
MKKADSRTEAAEAIAIQALAFLADDPKRLEHFVVETGMIPTAFRERGADPELLGAVMDYVLAFDDRLLNFAAFAQVKPASIVAARRSLPGSAPEW